MWEKRIGRGGLGETVQNAQADPRRNFIKVFCRPPTESFEVTILV